MASYLSAGATESLLAYSRDYSNETARRNRVANRMVDVAHNVVELVTAQADDYIEANTPTTTNPERLSARVHAAAVLSLIGQYDSEGQARSLPVVLAENLAVGAVVYQRITGSLHSVLVRNYEGSARPRIASPDDIYEGRVKVGATIDGNDYTVVGQGGAWVGPYDMPGHYTPRPNYRPASYLGQFSKNLLAAMADSELNPQFRTEEFVHGFDPELARRAADLNVPLDEVVSSLYLPEWLQPEPAA